MANYLKKNGKVLEKLTNSMKIPFYKCNGNGNTFILVLHNNTIKESIFNPIQIQKFCSSIENKLIDGLILINNKNNKIIMNYFNNDGSWETFCLNGLRCSSLLLRKKLNKKSINIICNNKLYKTKNLNDDFIQVELTKPTYKLKNVELDSYIGNFINSGAKHFVINHNNKWPSKNKLKEQLRKIRFNKLFSPKGTNVNFYKEIDSKTIRVKTYEKGIESMMQSCTSESFVCAYD